MLYTSVAKVFGAWLFPVIKDKFSMADALTKKPDRLEVFDDVDMGVSISCSLYRLFVGRSSFVMVEVLLFLRLFFDERFVGETFMSGVKVSGSPNLTIMLEFSSAVGIVELGEA